MIVKERGDVSLLIEKYARKGRLKGSRIDKEAKGVSKHRGLKYPLNASNCLYDSVLPLVRLAIPKQRSSVWVVKQWG